MICSCGLVAIFNRHTTFDYWYCGECKKEVLATEPSANKNLKMMITREFEASDWSNFQRLWEETFGVKLDDEGDLND